MMKKKVTSLHIALLLWRRNQERTKRRLRNLKVGNLTNFKLLFNRLKIIQLQSRSCSLKILNFLSFLFFIEALRNDVLDRSFQRVIYLKLPEHIINDEFFICKNRVT